MLTRFLIITFIFAFAAISAQANDRLQLNIRLHPIQTLTISDTESNPDKRETLSPEYITVSSASAFQVKVKREFYSAKKEDTKKHHDHNEYNLINHSKGVMHKKYNINKPIESIIKETGSVTTENNLLVLTIISK
ncbi:hypothetical protein MUU74_12725 [Chryseobacterium daecheongense]|uniref:hypothetical protein n=1 Tax=Chryseobacterium daecheongense TaxID=192389 RepID=UPI001FD65F96|nr:hypothetical protein [Chryseobacterium daecheongense]UOU97352.1 hypothetical protein MUU74_12725 [Chryseobacterium daecheongense]